jgi:hypothetical protein
MSTDITMIAMRSGVEDNRFIGGQRLIDVHRQIVKRAYGRHGAKLAIGEETAEFLLSSKSQRLSHFVCTRTADSRWEQPYSANYSLSLS